ncbi:putative NADPH:quinone reductase [Helianthus anomalus]
MEALVCRKLGDPTTPPDSSETTALSVSTSHPIPTLNSPTSIRIRIKSTSINYLNYLQILGKYQEKVPVPFVPGSDYSGVVESVGPEVTKFRVGDRVCSVAAVGSFAQFIVAEEKDLYGVPAGCDLVAAAALPIAYGTSYIALIHRANLKSGQVLLVLGAAGGVGLSAVQIGMICGATVIAVARGNEKVQLLKAMGVDHVVDLSKDNVIESTKAFLKTRKLKGVDVLYDPVGGKLTKESMKLLNWAAHILVIGFASGEVPVIPANIALVKNWTIHGLYFGSYGVNDPGVIKDSVKQLLSWLARGLITVNISHSYKLQEANLAFLDIRDRKVIGKVMITFDDPKTITSSKL